jgi:hypothetical protein
MARHVLVLLCKLDERQDMQRLALALPMRSGKCSHSNNSFINMPFARAVIIAK